MSDKTIPNFLDRLSSDEYEPQPYSEADRRVVARTEDRLRATAERYRLRPDRWSLASRTAAGLLALNAEHGERFYEVEEQAVADPAAAASSFAGDGPVIDVQTHFVAPHSARFGIDHTLGIYRELMPAWWSETDDIVKYDLAAYIRNIFLEADIGVAILTSGPGVDDGRMLFNDEMAATRTLIDGFAGSSRLLNHAVVHADILTEVEAMPRWRDEFNPAAWKVYTPGRIAPGGGWTSGWMLDDEEYGLPFLERVRQAGPKRICVHKGISGLVDNGSPRDIGPAAKAFPDIEFLVYHSGFAFPLGDAPAEGPYVEETANLGVNRLIHSCREAGIGPGGNVHAELGTTWFSLIRRPVEAAHVLGKLIRHFGADNVIWGSDSIWYGSQQPLIDAFRSFQIPDWMCERFGYEKLTPEAKEKILGRNAARVYGVDLGKVRAEMADDDLQWGKLLLEEFRRNGFSALR
jgi:hypothetical protein